MSPKDTEVIATISTTEAPVEVGEEPVITFQKFGEMELPEDEEVDDVDYVPSDIDSEDSLEWSSETEGRFQKPQSRKSSVRGVPPPAPRAITDDIFPKS